MQIEEAIQRADEIAKDLHGRHVKKDSRSRLSATCFAISQQHHNAILILLSRDPPLQATAFALLRPLTESIIRGLWLSHVASDKQVEDYVQNGTKLDIASMLNAIDKVTSGRSHQAIYKHWFALSAYTHTGEHQVQRWLRTAPIEPNYSETELSELIGLSNSLAEMTFQAVLAISTDQ